MCGADSPSDESYKNSSFEDGNALITREEQLENTRKMDQNGEFLCYTNYQMSNFIPESYIFEPSITFLSNFKKSDHKTQNMEKFFILP